MLFPSPLVPGTLEKRYKRFLADVTLEDGNLVTAHCANPGSMMGVSTPGSKVWLSTSTSKTRKLPYSFELIEVDGGLVAINTSNPNKIAEEAISGGVIPELTGYETLRREVKYGENSRIDILLEGGRRNQTCYVEIKNVHLRRAGTLAEFPDCVTTRGTKHLHELAAMVAEGARAVMLYIVQRTDCTEFAPAADLDPTYATTLAETVREGVEVLCYDCDITTSEVRLRRPLPISIAG
ncbi:MAG: DNA/RNA nuclease SfsA [Pseudomonadota bacterium]